MVCAQAALRVALHDIVGSSLELEVDPLCTVKTLKEKVASKWQMPAFFQTLMLDTAVLEDDEKLLCYCQGGSNALQLLVVASFQKAYETMASGGTKEKLVAMSAVAHMGPTSDERILKALNDLLEENNTAIRQAAAHTMSRVAPLGNEVAISLAQSRLAAHHPDIVCAAMEVISRVARHCAGDDLRRRVTQLATDESPQLRDAALRTLACIARPGDSASVRCILRGLEDPDRLVRVAAVRALSTLTMAELKESQQDLEGSSSGGVDGRWRYDASIAVTAWTALQASLAHADSWVRQYSVRLTPDIVAACSDEPGSLVSAVFALTMDPADEVRVAALRAASEIGLGRRNELLLSTVTARSRDACAAVRQAAVSAAAELAHLNVLPAVGLLSGLVTDTDSLVRRSAMEALAEVADDDAKGASPAPAQPAEQVGGMRLPAGVLHSATAAEAARRHAIVAGIAGLEDEATIVRLAAAAVLARLGVVGGHQDTSEESDEDSAMMPGDHEGSPTTALRFLEKEWASQGGGTPRHCGPRVNDEIADAFTRLTGREAQPMQDLHDNLLDAMDMVDLIPPPRVRDSFSRRF